MIIMGKAISHASSLVNYLFKEEKASKILDSEGIDLSSPKAIVGDLEMIKNSRLKNQYLSLVISPAKLESVYDKQNAKKNKTSLKNSDYHKQLGGAIEYAKKVLNEILYKPTTQHVDQIYDHMRSKGIEVNITQHKNKTYGVSLEHDGQKMKASDVSRLLSLKLLENGGYTANNKLQPILDRNTIHANTKRTERDILKDMVSDPGNQSAYLQEIRALKASMISKSNKKEDEMENDHKLKKKKKSKKGKQLGMRVKY